MHSGRMEEMPDPVRTMTELVVIQATPYCNNNCRCAEKHANTSPSAEEEHHPTSSGRTMLLTQLRPCAASWVSRP